MRLDNPMISIRVTRLPHLCVNEISVQGFGGSLFTFQVFNIQASFYLSDIPHFLLSNVTRMAKKCLYLHLAFAALFGYSTRYMFTKKGP